MNQSFWNQPPAHCDVVIVGGGLIGTSIALHLSMNDIGTCLLERGHLASGASGRNDGQIILETVDYYPRMIELYGHDTAKGILSFKRKGQLALHQFLEHVSHSPQLAYHRLGSLTLAYNQAERLKIEAAVDAMLADGFSCELVDGDTIASMIGTKVLDFGKYDPLDAVVNPAELTRLFAREAAIRGCQVHEGVQVTGVESGMVHHNYGATKCEIVIIATNAYCADILPSYKQWVYPTRGQVFATHPSPQRFQPVGCITNFGYDYWHWTEDGRLILGGRRFVDEHQEVGTEELVNQKVQAALESFAREIYPDMSLEVATRWSGIMGFSVDGLPIVGPVSGDPTVWSAVAFTGYGLGMAWSIGSGVADVLAGEETSEADFMARLSANRLG
ncbi:MAG: FAD-binding oxidoreductase [Acidobacteria bacterium]|nr:FAD-binding oxidoreductase [Acidobacteriota bacterium]